MLSYIVLVTIDGNFMSGHIVFSKIQKNEVVANILTAKRHGIKNIQVLLILNVLMVERHDSAKYNIFANTTPQGRNLS